MNQPTIFNFRIKLFMSFLDMSKSLTLNEVKEKILDLPNDLENEPVIITDNNKPVIVAISYEKYASLIETLDILADEEFTAQLKEGIKEDLAGERISWEEAQKQLEWQ
jgi:antitoxin YefM